MKKIAQVVFSTLLLSTTALARYNGPIIEKSSGGGFTPPEWSQFETCQIFQNKVVITKSFAGGELVTKEVRSLSVSGTGSLLGVVAKASLEALESRENGLCDAPTTQITASLIAPNDTIEKVVLFSSGGCGTPRLERNGAYASALKEVVNSYCAKTMDIGGQ